MCLREDKMNQNKNKQTLLFTTLTLIGLVLTVPIPLTAANTGDLQILNLSDDTFLFTTDQLLAMPKASTNADLWCYTELITTGTWGGVTLTELLSHVNSTSEVASLQFSASDGYKVTIPIELAKQKDVIVAYELDGQTLTEGLRLVLPGYNGAAWISGIEKIVLSELSSNYPDYIGAYDDIVDVLKKENDILRGQNTPATTPSPVPQKSQATPQPTPTTTPTIQAENKTSVTQQPQPTSSTPIVTVGSNIGNLSFYLALVVGLLLLTVVVTVSLIHKRKSSL